MAKLPPRQRFDLYRPFDPDGAYRSRWCRSMAARSWVEVVAGTAPPVGTVLCCGPYDLALARPDGPFGDLLNAVLWSYSGNRAWATSRDFAPWSVVRSVTPSFPPSFLTVGNADRSPHTTALAGACRRVSRWTRSPSPRTMSLRSVTVPVRLALDGARATFERIAWSSRGGSHAPDAAGRSRVERGGYRRHQLLAK
jgi:hypothetical protein